MSNDTLEREDGRPAGWRTNVVIRRGTDGTVARVEAEKEADLGEDDQTL